MNETRHPKLIELTAEHVRERMSGEGSGHDWWHVWRVWQTARSLAMEETADSLVVELAALLHDIADWKFHGGDEGAGPRATRHWLESIGVDEPVIRHVELIVATLSFKGANVATPMASLEGQIVQDADRLDAIGAIGIARAFAYGGHCGREMFDPSVSPELHSSFASYKKNSGPTINHFYEKLLLLRDRMNTTAGRSLAAERHAFMEVYLAQFFSEWHCEGFSLPDAFRR